MINSAYVLSDSLQQTIGGLNYAQGQSNTSPTSNTRPTSFSNTALWDDVIDVLENGIANVDALYFPDKVYDDDKDWHRKILQAHKAFIKAEVISFIQTQINNDICTFPLAHIHMTLQNASATQTFC